MSPAAVQRHKTNHLPKLMIKAKAIEEVASADTLLDQARNLLAKAERLTKRAEEEGSMDTALRGVGQIRGVLELLGTVSGQLAGKGTTVNVAVQIDPSMKPLPHWTGEEMIAEWSRRQRAKGVLQGVSGEPEPVTIEAKLLTD